MKRKYLHIICIAVCLLLLVLPVSAWADMGSFSGDSDYGSFDSGGSDWGGSSSWGDSGSSDFGSGVVVGSLLGGGGGGCTGGGLWTIITIIIVVVFIIITLARNSKKKKAANIPAGAQRTADGELMPIAGYTGIDPGFDGAALQEKLSNLYVQMQNCWQGKDLSPLRPYFTDALYEQFDRQVQNMKAQDRTNYIERIAVLGVMLRGYYQRGGDDHIVAEVRTRIVDYTVDDKSGELISGSKTAEKFMTYEWDLSRPTGTATAAEGAETTVHCPSCGAPVSINQSAKCPYCGSVITVAQHDWAIYSIKGLAQRTNG